MYRFPGTLLFCGLLLLSSVQSSVAQENPERISPSTVVVGAGVPLHIVIDKRTSYTKVGQPLIGHLSQSVYVFDRLAIPAGTEVLGSVAGVHPVSKRKRFDAISRGDFTPLREPEVKFYSLVLPDGVQVPIQSERAARDSAVVRMSSSSDQKGLWKQMKGTVKNTVSNEKQSVEQAIHRPNKLQWAKNSILARLPYHPQVFEAGTQFVAELQAPIQVQSPMKVSSNMADLGTKPPADSILHARLNSNLNSVTSKWGDPVEATLTEPLLTADRKLILPEGTRLIGSVTHAVPGKKFGQNGQLSFTFREIMLPSGMKQPVKGQLSGASSTASKVKIDEEGTAHATEPRAKYVVPLALVLLSQSLAENDEDGLRGSQPGSVNNGVAGGGFGLTGRVLAFSVGSRGLSYGLGYYGAGRAIYSRFIARGHDVVFPRDTQIEIKVGGR